MIQGDHRLGTADSGGRTPAVVSLIARPGLRPALRSCCSGGSRATRPRRLPPGTVVVRSAEVLGAVQQWSGELELRSGADSLRLEGPSGPGWWRREAPTAQIGSGCRRVILAITASFPQGLRRGNLGPGGASRKGRLGGSRKSMKLLGKWPTPAPRKTQLRPEIDAASAPRETQLQREQSAPRKTQLR